MRKQFPHITKQINTNIFINSYKVQSSGTKEKMGQTIEKLIILGKNENYVLNCGLSNLFNEFYFLSLSRTGEEKTIHLKIEF